MKILTSLLIVLALAAGCARRTVVYQPAASPATTTVVMTPTATTPAYVVTTPTVTTPVYVVTYDRASCKAAGGRWHSWANRCDF